MVEYHTVRIRLWNKIYWLSNLKRHRTTVKITLNFMHFDTDIARIRHLPQIYDHFKRAGWWLRKTFFAKHRSETPAVVVDLGVDEAENLLGSYFFEPGWEMSYHYYNEVLNMRRVECISSDEHSDIRWWQVHIRGYCHERDDDETCAKLELTAHFEPEPIEHPDEHLSEEFIDIRRGNEVLVELLEKSSISYTKIRDWP